MSELSREAALREVSVKAISVNDDDDLDALLSGGMPKEKAIAEMTDLLLDNLDGLDDWLDQSLETNNVEATELIAERDRLKQELEDLRSQHQFECEYVDQLEQEITSISSDRERQVSELTIQLEQLQSKAAEQLTAKISEHAQRSEHQDHSPISDDRDLSDRLAIHILQLEEEFQHRLAIALEIESQKIAQQHLQKIDEKSELIDQLQDKNSALAIANKRLTEELESANRVRVELTKALEIAQSQLLAVTSHRDRIEEELIQHLSNQAKLHQSLKGLENEYVNDLTLAQDSEQQIADLQEQILRQASKSAEYEAAIQHWKEQSVRHQHHALQLSGALDRLLDEKPVKHLTQSPLNRSSELPSDIEYLSERSLESQQNANQNAVSARSLRAKVDLPAFLVRHR